jgi:hypothetical protein
MKYMTTALLTAALASLAACGGSGANNAATANNNVEALPPVDNVTDLGNTAPGDLNASNAAAGNAASNAAATNSTGNAL